MSEWLPKRNSEVSVSGVDEERLFPGEVLGTLGLCVGEHLLRNNDKREGVGWDYQILRRLLYLSRVFREGYGMGCESLRDRDVWCCVGLGGLLRCSLVLCGFHSLPCLLAIM